MGTIFTSRTPEPPLDPPDEQELPEPDSKCSDCGEDKWGDVELDRDGDAVAHCQSEVNCPGCDGDGKATADPNEGVALVLMGENVCDTCGGSGKIKCDGEWTKCLSAPERERERD